VDPAEAVAVDAELLFPVDLLLRVQERGVGIRVPLRRAGREERRGDAAVFSPVGWILDGIERLVEYGGFGRPVKVIRHER
jgi:hypothetical protein